MSTDRFTRVRRIRNRGIAEEAGISASAVMPVPTHADLSQQRKRAIQAFCRQHTSGALSALGGLMNGAVTKISLVSSRVRSGLVASINFALTADQRFYDGVDSMLTKLDLIEYQLTEKKRSMLDAAHSRALLEMQRISLLKEKHVRNLRDLPVVGKSAQLQREVHAAEQRRLVKEQRLRELAAQLQEATIGYEDDLQALSSARSQLLEGRLAKAETDNRLSGLSKSLPRQRDAGKNLQQVRQALGDHRQQAEAERVRLERLHNDCSAAASLILQSLRRSGDAVVAHEDAEVRLAQNA